VHVREGMEMFLQTVALIEMQITVVVVIVSLSLIVLAVMVRMLQTERNVCFDTGIHRYISARYRQFVF